MKKYLIAFGFGSERMEREVKNVGYALEDLLQSNRHFLNPLFEDEDGEVVCEDYADIIEIPVKIVSINFYDRVEGATFVIEVLTDEYKNYLGEGFWALRFNNCFICLKDDFRRVDRPMVDMLKSL